MAKTIEQCAAEIQHTILTGLVTIAAAANARVTELEDQLAEAIKERDDAMRRDDRRD